MNNEKIETSPTEAKNVYFIKSSKYIDLPIKLPELFTSLSGFAWPLFFLILILIFKKKFESLIDRISRLEAFGGHAEFQKDLGNLKESVNEVQEMIDNGPKEKSNALSFEKDNQDILEIINLSKNDPSLGLMKLSTLIEKEVRHLIASMGLLKEINASNLRNMLKQIEERHALAKSLTTSIDNFLSVRNRVVHGASVSKNDIISAVDIGLNLLKAVRTIPHQKVIVSRINIQIFRDPECTSAYENIKGVLLDSFDNHGIKLNSQIFPTTRTHFQVGKQVAWEWNMNLITEKSWYKNEKGEVLQGWHSSAEFIGRNIEDI